ncbi:MAG TPA: 3-oxoacyl-ACP synthase [Achromobacter sp.]|nr:3-oxoacyl-ACP synthase [Achromobacter sp.]
MDTAMKYSAIAGTGSFLPERVVSNDELAAELATRDIATSDEWIVERTGIRQRHLAERGVTTSQLATEASRRALADAGVDASEVDLIIVATSTPDFVFPSTACLVQANLGTKGSAAFDVQAVCSGFVYALTTADSFIRAGRARCALVIGAEVFSRILDWNDRSTCVLFGDGAGAVVLMNASVAAKRGIKPLARLVAYAHAGVDPDIMGIGPVPATQAALKRAGLTVDQLDVIEANEAFAAQACAVSRELKLDPAKVNPNGSGIGLGHPIGATGAIITVKALHELQRVGGRYALVTMCIGGGQGIAAIFERI